MRRYPALAYLVGAGLLALLLPSALTIPNSGPPTLAEYAPVTGKSDSATGDVAAFGETSSGGVGSGRGGRPGQTTVEEQQDITTTGRFVRRGGTKRCVGDPPRQTEDPLSPPCIAFYDGNNGGATTKGVTADEVTAVVELERSNPDDRAGQIFDCAEAPNDKDKTQDVACKAYMRFFNDRFQTYKRTIHLWSSHALSLDEVQDRKNPFAFGAQGSPGGSKYKVVGFGYNGSGRTSQAKNAPYQITFRPDIEDEVQMAATYVCLKLNNRPARYAGNLADRNAKRVFGMWVEEGVFRTQMEAALKDICGIKIAAYATGIGDTSAAARLKQAGVTTVIAKFGNGSLSGVTAEASQGLFTPEWFLPGSSAPRSIEENFYGRTADQSQWAHAFGITFDYRRDAVADQAWYRAYHEACPDCVQPAATNGGSNTPYAYDMLTMLFYGIQAAGPKLSADTIDRGLHSIPARGSDDPYRPAAYFAPGNYSFLKDAMEIVWDPSGRAPGAANAGCYRLPELGRRYRAGEWPAGDDSIGKAGPCQGDNF